MKTGNTGKCKIVVKNKLKIFKQNVRSFPNWTLLKFQISTYFLVVKNPYCHLILRQINRHLWKLEIGNPPERKPGEKKPFRKVNNLNDNKILKLTCNIKINLIKKDLSRARKNKVKTKTEGNAKRLFILTRDKSLFNGLEFIKNMKSNKSWHTVIMGMYFLRNSE